MKNPSNLNGGSTTPQETSLESDLSVAGQEPDMMDEEAQDLFRIADEALTNVERHAAVDPDRFGMTGIQERAAMIGATLKVHSRPGGGTRIWCSLER